MLKTVKRTHQPTQLKVAQRELNRSSHYANTEIPNLFDIDPYPESERPPKIDLRLYQLEDFE